MAAGTEEAGAEIDAGLRRALELVDAHAVSHHVHALRRVAVELLRETAAGVRVGDHAIDQRAREAMRQLLGG